MTVEIKNLDYAFPNCLALKSLFYGHTLNMSGIRAMQAPDCLA